MLFNVKLANIPNMSGVTSCHVLDGGMAAAAYRTSAVYACFIGLYVSWVVETLRATQHASLTMINLSTLLCRLPWRLGATR